MIALPRRAIFARPVTPAKLYPRTALALLTALNLLNYIDRSVLFAVQDLVKAEFHRSDAAFGLLTSVFFIFYMCAAPFMGPLSLRFSRKAGHRRRGHGVERGDSAHRRYHEL